ncbi:MAG: tRNA pseudouridine synthase A, partial [Duodenibacillus sp.]|nr:tRNA pseudouridine synthase A [Duodenibacillus sp.]
ERPERSWVRALNTYLPDDVAVRWARSVDEQFSARFSARARTYQYWICNDPVRSPVFAGRAGWVWRPCDAEAMHEGAQALVGEHDFTSFRAAECQAASPVRAVHAISVKRFGSLIGVEVTANAFLQHMVRNIVGTLVYVGTGREQPGWVREVLEARRRAVAAPTFDASGLYLTGVRYPEAYALPERGCDPFHPLG